MSRHNTSFFASLLLATGALAVPAFPQKATAAIAASSVTKFVPAPTVSVAPRPAEPMPYAGIGVGVSASTRSFTSSFVSLSSVAASSQPSSGLSRGTTSSSNSDSSDDSSSSSTSNSGRVSSSTSSNTNTGSNPVPAGIASTGSNLQQQAQTVPQGIFTASDGSSILDTTVTIDGQSLRFRVSGPASAFMSKSQVDGAQGTGNLGINVLLHGDGGQTFWDFPNQDVTGGLMGVALLAPDANLCWGGGSGVNRVKGELHSQIVNDFILNELPKWIAFDPSKVFFTGVDGGSMLLSGFFIPTYMQNFKGNGVLLNCGAMVPHVGFKSQADVFRTTRIHFQSTQNELDYIQKVIPQAFNIYQKTGKDAGLSAAEISSMQTVNNSPVGGHCAFDSKSYKSGVQLVMNNFGNIMFDDGTGMLPGVGNVLQGTTSSATALKWGKPGAVV